jgi:hypothetical protein
MSSKLHAGKLSSGVRFVAIESNAMNRPLLLIERPWLGLPQFPIPPSLASEIKSVVGLQPEGAPVQLSRTYTLPIPFTFVCTRSVPIDANATSRPSALIAGIVGLDIP